MIIVLMLTCLVFFVLYRALKLCEFRCLLHLLGGAGSILVNWPCVSIPPLTGTRENKNLFSMLKYSEQLYSFTFMGLCN